jgi:cytoskeletal protein CcmA (bactofilin family)
LDFRKTIVRSSSNGIDTAGISAYTGIAALRQFTLYVFMAIFQRERQNNSSEKQTIIGATVKVDGNFVGAGDVFVEGHVAGTLKTSKDLHVGPGATIKADVEAANITVAGEIRGHVKCGGKIDLAPSGKIFGNVDTQTIAVAHGAVLHGKVSMAGHEPAATAKGDRQA